MCTKICFENSVAGLKHRLECVAKNKNRTLCSIADEMGVAPSTLSNIKTGRNSNGATLKSLAATLRVSERWFRYGLVYGKMPDCAFLKSGEASPVD